MEQCMQVGRAAPTDLHPGKAPCAASAHTAACQRHTRCSSCLACSHPVPQAIASTGLCIAKCSQHSQHAVPQLSRKANEKQHATLHDNNSNSRFAAKARCLQASLTLVLSTNTDYTGHANDSLKCTRTLCLPWC